jgi:hypothetical protein
MGDKNIAMEFVLKIVVQSILMPGGPDHMNNTAGYASFCWPTVVSPVRSGNSPVMKFARPAVQLASA